jgi:hypothetical protein
VAAADGKHVGQLPLRRTPRGRKTVIITRDFNNNSLL